MELTAYFHRIYSIVPWNPLNFHGINGKNLWHFMNFHNFLLLVYLPSTAMETLKMPSEYSIDFNRGFQGFSMANLEKGSLVGKELVQELKKVATRWERVCRKIAKVTTSWERVGTKLAKVTNSWERVGTKLAKVTLVGKELVQN